MAEEIVVSIHLASAPTEPMRGVVKAHAVPGRGLEGDRYSEGLGTFSGSPDTELTLGEARRYMITALALELEATGQDDGLGLFDRP